MLRRSANLHFANCVLICIFTVSAFWLVGPSRFPDYQNYLTLSQDSYDYFFEFISGLILTTDFIAGDHEDRVIFFILLVQSCLVLSGLLLALVRPKYAFGLSLVFAYYYPFLLTTGLRTALPYMMCGVFAVLLLNRRMPGWALLVGCLSCFFHDSAIVPLLTMGVAALWPSPREPRRLYYISGCTIIASIFSSFSLINSVSVLPEDLELIGRFSAYATNDLNSPEKLVFLLTTWFMILTLVKFARLHPMLKRHLIYGVILMSFVSIINQVVALRLLGFYLPASLFIYSRYISSRVPDAPCFIAAFILLFSVLNIWLLV